MSDTKVVLVVGFRPVVTCSPPVGVCADCDIPLICGRPLCRLRNTSDRAVMPGLCVTILIVYSLFLAFQLCLTTSNFHNRTSTKLYRTTTGAVILHAYLCARRPYPATSLLNVCSAGWQRGGIALFLGFGYIVVVFLWKGVVI